MYYVQLSQAISKTETESFDQVFPAIIKMSPDYLIIDLADSSPELSGQMMFEELQKDTTDQRK